MQLRNNQPSVCVIGAGVSGLACVKELMELGIQVEAYEMMPLVGGVFGSYTWKGGQFTLSSIFTWYSELPVDNRQKFFTWEEFLGYLEGYCDHFQLRDRIHLNSKVVSAEQKEDKWVVKIHRKNWSNGHYFHPKQEVEEQHFEKEFTHLVVCSGLHNVATIPHVDHLDQFRGVILHSKDYRDPEDFRGKKVLVVGSGESASDIAAQVAQVTEQCTISMRAAPGTLFPRDIQGNTPDIRDDSLTYNLPRIWWPLILRGHRRFYLSQKADRDLFQWAANSNYHNNRCSFTTNACKSFGIPEAILKRGAVLKPQIRSASVSEMTFDDGSSLPFDAIIFCTGYKVEFSFFDHQLSSRLLPVNRLWKNCVPADMGTSLFLVGFSRPQQINLVTMAEMQGA